LVSLLKTQSIKVGFSVNENEFPKDIQEALQKLGISDVNLNFTHCDGMLDYEFTTTWSSKATLYFLKDFCNKKQTVKGFHYKPSDMIEVWGLGHEWTMWIDYDFI
jgi:hypothetical protein